MKNKDNDPKIIPKEVELAIKELVGGLSNLTVNIFCLIDLSLRANSASDLDLASGIMDDIMKELLDKNFFVKIFIYFFSKSLYFKVIKRLSDLKLI